MDTARVFDVILRSAAGVGADVCELWLLSAAPARLTLAASRHSSAPTSFAEEGELAVSMDPAASGLLAEVMQTGTPRVVARAELDARGESADPFLERARGRGAASVVVAPIEVGRRPAGLLVLAREQPGSSPFDAAEVDATASVASLASASLERLKAGASPAPLRAIVDNLPAMVAYWDTTLRCRFANRAYETWFGVDPEALVGQTMQEFLGPLFAMNAPYIEKVLRGEPQEFEREIPDPRGGAPRHSQAHYIPDVVEGEVRGFCVLVVDVGRRKKAEAAVASAKEQAEAANRELEAFSYSVAHDLRAPLRGMSGFAALLVEEYRSSLNAEALDWLNEIVQSAAKMAGLIDALLGPLTHPTRPDQARARRCRDPRARRGRAPFEDGARAPRGIRHRARAGRLRGRVARAGGRLQPAGQRVEIHRGLRAPAHRGGAPERAGRVRVLRA